MWAKTFAALIGGCILSISLMLNIKFMTPFSVGTQLFVGLIVAFPIWTTLMLWCYASKNGKQAWLRCLLLLLPSVLVNMLFLGDIL